MTITYYRKQVYGKTLNYIIDATLAKQYELLTGDKTLTEGNASLIKLMFDVDFKEVLQPKN